MKGNATIKEVRETRKRISAKFEHSPKCLVEYYKQKQTKKPKLNDNKTNN